ncbi:MAG TPA: lysoplasmalogenase [Cyclobacteriaceae bacterium]|nr:lysoplasmalogenase [Cyclobacteriaceae bacterium]
MNRQAVFIILFAGASLVDLVAASAGWSTGEMFSKPLIVLSLIGYYLSSDAVRNTTFVRALFFCWTGDILLIFQSEAPVFFMAGLGAFLIGQILYIISFRRMQEEGHGNELSVPQKMRFSFPVVLAGTGLVAILFPKLAGLKFPVLLYAIALMLMVMTAIFRYGRTNPKSYWPMLFGAILFMISDATLAMNKFYSPVPTAGLWIMLTYVAAQYLIVRAAINHKKSVEL